MSGNSFCPDSRGHRKRIQMRDVFHIARADKREKCARQTLQATRVRTGNAEPFSMALPIPDGFYTEQRNYLCYKAVLFLLTTSSYCKGDYSYALKSLSGFMISKVKIQKYLYLIWFKSKKWSRWRREGRPFVPFKILVNIDFTPGTGHSSEDFPGLIL